MGHGQRILSRRNRRRPLSCLEHERHHGCLGRTYLSSDHKLGAVDTHGGIDHLRPYVGKGKKLPAGLLVWLTDHTPHEALPQIESGYRQFFRLVTADISVWFAAQSTPNPKVPVPSHVEIIGESKFSTPSEGATRIYTKEDFGDDIVSYPEAAGSQGQEKAQLD